MSWPNTQQRAQHLLELPINLHMLQKRGFRQRLLATSPAIIHCYKIIFYYSNRARGQPGLSNEWDKSSTRHKAQFLWVFGFGGFFFCYNRGGLRLAEARTGFGGRGEDWETTELPTHGQIRVFYSQEKRNCRSKSLKLSKSYILMGAWGLLMACPAEKSEGRKTNLLKADLVKWSLARTDKRVLSRRLK